MKPTETNSEQGMTHVVYDKTTGRIVGTLRHYDMASGEYGHYDPDKVLELFASDNTVLSKVKDGDVSNLAMTATELPANTKISALRFSEKRQALVARQRLRLRTDREVIEGDGEDSVTIFIDVIDEDERIQHDYASEVHVTTTRGKLDAKGGRVAVENGRGKVVLTSVRETVDRVQVKARAQDGSAVSDEMTLSFE